AASFRATANKFTGARKLDVNTLESKQYLEFLDDRFESFSGEAMLKLGRQLKPVHRYRNVMNGFAVDLSESEVKALRDMPRVRGIGLDENQHVQTDAGPNWIGADIIRSGNAGFPATGGEGVVVGVIDTGINWDHYSFSDPGEGGGSGWDHENPYDTELGLCTQPEVLCNDKLVGVYDFVEDEGGQEETNNGEDNIGHGSHVSTIVLGNPTSLTLNGTPTQIAGVAPNANLISYRVCYIGDPVDPEDDACQTSAIIRAIDQAVSDGVDIVNHSIGGPAHDPWIPWSSTYAFLNLREAGIFVATAGGNEGPNPGTVGSPENAPWITSVGAASHDRIVGSLLENLSGGDTTPPGMLVGQSSNEGIGLRTIVHASDYGYPLCATGTSESGATCDDNTGASSPFAPGTFNGEIVVCDRDTEYGRVERGKNLLLAGAGGYVLANTETSVQELYIDDLCLPSTHIDRKDGDKLRTWLDSGIGHQGSISGFGTYYMPEAGDIIADFSSRGPNLPPVADIMKPDLIAPGVQILGATDAANANDYIFYDGTSQSSPHVAGGAALIKSVHPDWTPAMIASALVMTATPEQAIDFDDSVATVHKRGGGRPRLEVAVNAGLFLDETIENFENADPEFGGEPGALNLPGLIETSCGSSCSFQRTVTDLAGGASWIASAEGFAAEVAVSITPNNFNLTNGASQQLTIEVDLTQAELVGQWVYGEVRLTSNGIPDAVFPLAVYASGGDLPAEWTIDSNSISGWLEFSLDNLVKMPDATYTSGGLVEPTLTTENLPQDPNDDPYDQSEGKMTVWHNVPAETLWFHTETLKSTLVNDLDLDLYVGLDSNKNGRADEHEQLCSSTSADEVELCDLFTPVAGDYWILVQNWVLPDNYDPERIDEATLKSAVVGKNTNSRLTASGNGIVPAGETQPVRLSWDNVGAVPGTELMGAVGIGTRRETPNNIGIIPVVFNKTGVAAPETLVLMNGVTRGLTLSADGSHDRMFVDIPPGTDSFTISATAQGLDTGLNESLGMELYRDDFDDAFTDAPFISAPDTSGGPLTSASGTESGVSTTVSGDVAIPGRWYVVLKNTSATNAHVEIMADMSFTGTPVPLRKGLWEASSREGIGQGLDYIATAGGYRAILWYTYDETGQAAWYIASGLEPVGNVWVADLLRVTNDGSLQQESPVGHVSVTLLAEEDSIFSFVLFGEEGSDRERPSLPPTCPTIDETERSYHGTWSPAAAGVGGATVVVNGTSQAFLHYIFDGSGRPVWLLGTPEPQSPTEPESTLLQFGGFCAVCSTLPVTSETAGVFTREFTSESTMNWNLDYALNAPLSGSINRSDETTKLTAPVVCE
ncbi:MAG: S8 family serine peptidase, partial [Gammaproteobacteria bacterium]|nr:S8 family serine peptidase [Gammaproteobacteria bacterium]